MAKQGDINHGPGKVYDFEPEDLHPPVSNAKVISNQPIKKKFKIKLPKPNFTTILLIILIVIGLINLFVSLASN